MLKEGDAVPAFSLPCDDGSTVRASSLGKAVLFFYPRDSTPGCTRESQAFSAQLRAFQKLGVKVYGISRDSLASHHRFKQKFALTVPLLSDADLGTHLAFGAWGQKTMYGKKVEGVIRSTFVVEGGKVRRVWPSVKVDGHAEAVLVFLTGAPVEAPVKKAKKATPAKKKASFAKTKKAR